MRRPARFRKLIASENCIRPMQNNVTIQQRDTL